MADTLPFPGSDRDADPAPRMGGQILVDKLVAQGGTIRMHQERDDPGRISATRLVNPDFAPHATAFGGHGETVRATAEFASAFGHAVASGEPAILHCLPDPRARSVGRDMPEGQPL